MKLGPVLLLPTIALRTTAAALRLLAGTGERLADLLSPDGDTPVVYTEPQPPRPAPSHDVTPPAQPAMPEQIDVTTLASRPAPEVIAALDSLGTVELADLYDHESKHRRRRAVLDAIEAAAAPPAPGTDEALLADVREPDELVYSTQTPQR